MITEWFVQLSFTVSGWVAGLFPDFEIPQWMLDSRGAMVGFLESMSGLGVWVDWGALALCVGAVAAAYGIGILIKLIRVGISHVPFFGGSGGS